MEAATVAPVTASALPVVPTLRTAALATRSNTTQATQSAKDERKTAAERAVQSAVEKLRAAMACAPDDKDELAEEKTAWVREWDGALVSIGDPRVRPDADVNRAF